MYIHRTKYRYRTWEIYENRLILSITPPPNRRFVSRCQTIGIILRHSSIRLIVNIVEIGIAASSLRIPLCRIRPRNLAHVVLRTISGILIRQCMLVVELLRFVVVSCVLVDAVRGRVVRSLAVWDGRGVWLLLVLGVGVGHFWRYGIFDGWNRLLLIWSGLGIKPW